MKPSTDSELENDEERNNKIHLFINVNVGIQFNNKINK